MFAALHRSPMPVTEAMERAGITDIAKQKTTKLSGGQAQRVRYALALVPDPDLLVLDEPTVAMDVEVRRSFWASMRDFTGSGRTVLFATHYLDEADAFADRVVVLADGMIIADGTGAQIKASVAGRTISAVIPGGRPGDLSATAGSGRRRAGGRPDATALQRLRRGAAGIAGRLRRPPTTSRSPPATSRTPFSNSPPPIVRRATDEHHTRNQHAGDRRDDRAVRPDVDPQRVPQRPLPGADRRPAAVVVPVVRQPVPGPGHRRTGSVSLPT